MGRPSPTHIFGQFRIPGLRRSAVGAGYRTARSSLCICPNALVRPKCALQMRSGVCHNENHSHQSNWARVTEISTKAQVETSGCATPRHRRFLMNKRCLREAIGSRELAEDVARRARARVVKLIPSEVIATYLAIGNLLPALSEGHWEHLGTWVNFTFFWIATPIVLFIAGKAENKRPSVTHLTMSTIAFPIWAYNVAGSVDLYGLQFRSAPAKAIPPGAMIRRALKP